MYRRQPEKTQRSQPEGVATVTQDSFLDRHERHALDNDLQQLVTWLADDLDAVVTKQTRYTSGSAMGKRRRKASDEATLPFNDTVSTIAHEIAGTLQTWVDEVCTQRHYPHPGFMRAIDSSRWLRKHLYALALCDDAKTAADEIHDAVKRALRAVDRPRFRSYQGQCEACGADGETCGADLWAHRDADKIVCPACLEVIDKQVNDRKIMAKLETRSFTANELVDIIADRFGTTIKAKTVHDLAYRRTNPIPVRGHTYDQQKLYRAGDVFHALRQRKLIA